MKGKLIQKANGEFEVFNEEKFKRSLKKAGASDKVAHQLFEEICRHGELKTTREIYRYAIRYLHRHQRPAASHYNMKYAVMSLGPDGFPFEHFVGAIFEKLGYRVRTGQVMKGFCVTHEVDVVIEKDGYIGLIECKFHNQPGVKTSVKVPMYILSRYTDLKKQLSHTGKYRNSVIEGWIITNTKFTTDATNFGECYGLNLKGWTYPNGDSLYKMIDQADVHPVTSLTSLTPVQQKSLLKKDVVTCRQLIEKPDYLQQIGVKAATAKRIITEAHATCEHKK